MARSDMDWEAAGALASEHTYVILAWRVFLAIFWHSRRHTDREPRAVQRRLMRAARREFWRGA